MVGVFTVLPVILSGFFGGPVIDRLGYRRTSIIADIMSGLTVGMIPLLYHTIGLAFWELLVLVFLGALFDTPGSVARESLVPEVTHLADMQLERINSIYQSIHRLSALLGAPLAGILIAIIGTSSLLWIDAATFAISAALTLALVPEIASAASESGSYIQETLDGLRFILRDQLVFWLVIIIAILNFLDAPRSTVLLPIYASEHFGSASALGLMLGVSGAGALVGSLAFGAFGSSLPRRKTLLAALMFSSLLLFTLVAEPPLFVVLATLIIRGIVSGPLNPLLITVLQERVPSSIRGRVFGAMFASVYIAVPASMLITGFVTGLVGVRIAIMISAGLSLVVALSLIFNHVLHEMNVEEFDSSAS